MEPTRELVDAIYRDRVLRARATPPGEKILDGPRLFEFVCRIAMDGIRQRYPLVDDAEVRRLLSRRLARKAQLEETR